MIIFNHVPRCGQRDQKAREKAKKKGLPEPTNFGGAADEAF